MGKAARELPQNLPAKLRHIREALSLSQLQMIDVLNVKGLRQSHISSYELGLREPTLITLLQYSRLANICIDVLIDDDIELPNKIPAKKTYHPH